MRYTLWPFNLQLYHFYLSTYRKMDDNQYDQKLKKLKAYLPFLENIISNFEHIPERQPQVTKMKTLHKLLLNDKR